MTDIVEWLRGKPMVVNESGYTGISVAGGTLLNKAADEIEKLREERNRLREIIDKQMVKEFADRWANHILYDQPKMPQGFPSLLDALKEKK